MPQTPATSGPPVLRIALIFAAIIIALGTYAQVAAVAHVFDRAGNDDIMRMLSVRSWLAGQGWFDMTQYGLLSPDGISLHWSRYVDVGIGALVALIAVVWPMAQAEQFAGVAWPKLLLLLQVLVVGFGTRRLIGEVAAGFAVLCVLLWPVFGQTYFTVGAVDHHNVQTFVITVAVFAALMDGRPALWGATAGVAAAFSLAIGLETLIFISAMGVMLVERAAQGPQTAHLRLTGFCLAIIGGALIFFAGQSAPSDWFVITCDRLSPPYLAIAGVGAAAGLSLWLLPARLRRFWPQMTLTAGVAAAGLVIIKPLLDPCLAAPYANLPVHIQQMIATDITEALPAIDFARRNLLAFNNVLTGAIAAVVIATVLWWRMPQTPVRRTVGQALILGWIGLVACGLQIRQVVLLASVVPLLTGFVMAEAWRWRQISRSSLSSLVLAGFALVTLLPAALGPMVADVFAIDRQSATASAPAQDQACRDLATMALLEELPASRVLTPMNLGPRLVLVTDHVGLAAPYHRSPRAMINGYDPFVGDVAAMAKVIMEEDVGFVVVCKGSFYGAPDTAGSTLATGEGLPGLAPVAMPDPDLLVYRVELP